MVISSIDGIVAGLGNGAQRFVINRASIAAQIVGQSASLWRGTGIPAQGAIPTAAAVCTNALAGSFQFTAPTGANASYIARAFALSSNSATDIQFHDRLAHMGGLLGNIITAQTVSVDVSGSGGNMEARRGGADYSDVQWWMEWYTATGATIPTVTVTYTNAAGTSGRTTTVLLTASVGASRMFPIIGAAGEFIQSIQSVQLSVSTGTAGNFGVTATRGLTSISLGLANAGTVYDWQMLGLPKVEDSACIFLTMFPGTTSTGTLVGFASLVQG